MSTSGRQTTLDRLSRPLRDLRLSVTDRCNFRCRYCMPREVFGTDFEFLRRSEILSYEEITRLVAVSRRLGVRKVRITGGEPLLRTDLPQLIEMLRDLGPLELALTTNGVLLPKLAGDLAAAGLDRVTVSLDSLDDAVFRRMNDADVSVREVLRGIEAAAAAGLDPIKINVVVMRGVNDGALVDFVRYFRGSGYRIRFIEYMDVGNTNGWRLDDVVPGEEILARLRQELDLESIEPAYPGEVARRWRDRATGDELGLITSVSRPFCSSCTRARLSAEGKLYTCLFASRGVDLRPLLRSGADDDAVFELLERTWAGRDDQYSEIRTANTDSSQRVEMSYIGG